LGLQFFPELLNDRVALGELLFHRRLLRFELLQSLLDRERGPLCTG
jgi:hypothetical protein